MNFRVKKRVGIHLDMTPMVDVGFLLLIFYMTTTQFKPPEKKDVNLPLSSSEQKMPEKSQFTITVPEKDSIFIDFAASRKAILEDGAVTERTYRNVISLDSKEANRTGEYVRKLQVDEANYINSNYIGENRKKRVQAVWDTPIVIKADRSVDYGIVEELMNSLRSMNLNSFKIITELKPAMTGGK